MALLPPQNSLVPLQIAIQHFKQTSRCFCPFDRAVTEIRIAPIEVLHVEIVRFQKDLWS